jgi:hypothetical protein
MKKNTPVRVPFRIRKPPLSPAELWGSGGTFAVFWAAWPMPGQGCTESSMGLFLLLLLAFLDTKSPYSQSGIFGTSHK